MHSDTKRADRPFLLLTAMAVLLGLMTLTYAGAPVGYEKFGDIHYFIKRQLIFGLLPGIFLFILIAHKKYQFWQKYSSIIYFLAVIFLVLVFAPGIGVTINRARSWLAIGSYGFQPSEFAKLAVVVVLAKLLVDPERKLDDWQYGLLPMAAIVGLPLLLIAAQPDVGTLLIIALTIFGMLFLGDVPRRFLIVLGIACVFIFIFLMMAAPYRVQRLTTFLHPELDPQGVGYQINQAYLAVGSGGWWGLGIGQSRQKFQYLPEVQADSIFAVMAEEMGFIRTSLIVILILAIGIRALRIAKSAPDKFGRLVAGGIGLWFVGQSFLNISAIIGLMPLTGVPLPFVSHGGSALMMELAAAGVVASVSRG